jgi:PTS system mannose-specific IIA component
MIGIIVASHGELGRELVRTAELVVGKIPHCTVVSVDDVASSDELSKRFSVAVSSVDAGEGVLILTDMFGGTPANLGLSMLSEGHVEVLTGVNLPMLIKLASHRESHVKSNLNETARLIKYYGQKNISVASDLLAS